MIQGNIWSTRSIAHMPYVDMVLSRTIYCPGVVEMWPDATIVLLEKYCTGNSFLVNQLLPGAVSDLLRKILICS